MCVIVLKAEFGDHDSEKHTLEYLQDFPLLPKPMMAQFPRDKLGTLTDAIITQHASLRGIAQQLAEVYYIVGAQQLDGYGQVSSNYATCVNLITLYLIQ